MKTSKVFIITGNQGEGKTTCLSETVQLLKGSGQEVYGFYATGEWKFGQRSRFHIRDVNTGKNYLLCSRKKLKADKGNFVFISGTLQKGEQIIAEGMKRQNVLAIIDEIGRFELTGKVWFSALNKLLENNLPVLITVRESLLQQVIDKFSIEQPMVFHLEEKCALIADKIIGHITDAGIIRNSH